MDNLGDWLYLVLLVVAGVSGLFNSGKKKKQQTEAKPHNPAEEAMPLPKKKSFWELLEEVSTEETTKAKKKVVPKAAPKKQKEHQPAAKATPFLTAESAIPSTIASNYKDELAVGEGEESGGLSMSDFHLNDREEVRKAIIYSEILNRKY